jgi:hypothetical protein
MKNVLIILGLAFIGFYIYKALSKEKAKNRRVSIQDSLQTLVPINQVEKEQILSRLNEIRNRYLENLVNYEITFLAQTELEDYALAEKVNQKYPKTLSRTTIEIAPLYKQFDIKLVDECVLGLLEDFGGKDFALDQDLPSVRFEYFIREKAKEKARMLFDEFIYLN